MTTTDDTTQHPERHAAGLFDIRNIIGALLAIYGVVLLLTAAFGGNGPSAKNSSANLWMGIALLVFGVLFLLWARLRPIVVDEVALQHELADDQNPAGHGPAE